MLVGIAVVVQGLLTQPAGTDTSLEAVCRAYPERVVRLFDALNLGRPGLESVKAAADAKDWPRACGALLDYYKSSAWAAKMHREPKPQSEARDADADPILNDTFTLYEVAAKAPRRPDGGLDWTYNGPTGDKEWGWGLNRHPWISTLLGAYQNTGNPTYVRALDALIRDWVASNPYPGVHNSTPQWRGLEVFCRVAMRWPSAFYCLQEAPEFTPAARILMLSSIPDHAHYNRNFHGRAGNWIAMELLGLESAAAYWPEFKEADAWYDYAVSYITPELTNQVYPDGVQKELASNYHLVALRSFDRFRELAANTGREIPAEFGGCIERMYDYIAYTMTPSGEAPLNNDSDLESVRSDVMAKAAEFKRPDWAFIATNGSQGMKPEGAPSKVYPWAGQVIMRSGWDADAHWAFFDAGPMGIAHQHWDKLHLSVAAYGRDILVDGGRYTYQAGPWRTYFARSQDHNVIVVDGHDQNRFETEAKEPMNGNYALTPQFDFVRGVFDAGYEDVEGKVVHTRAVLYVRGGYWLVVDRVATDRPHEITALWHFHPDCTVAADGVEAASTDEGKGNVRIVPSAGIEWKLELIRGRDAPQPQGWYSALYNVKEPNTCVAYTAPITGPTTFAWLILPAKGAVPKASVTIAGSDDASSLVQVKLPDAPTQTVRIPLTQGVATMD